MTNKKLHQYKDLLLGIAASAYFYNNQIYAMQTHNAGLTLLRVKNNILLDTIDKYANYISFPVAQATSSLVTGLIEGIVSAQKTDNPSFSNLLDITNVQFLSQIPSKLQKEFTKSREQYLEIVKELDKAFEENSKSSKVPTLSSVIYYEDRKIMKKTLGNNLENLDYYFSNLEGLKGAYAAIFYNIGQVLGNIAQNSLKHSSKALNSEDVIKNYLIPLQESLIKILDFTIGINNKFKSFNITNFDNFVIMGIIDGLLFPSSESVLQETIDKTLDNKPLSQNLKAQTKKYAQEIKQAKDVDSVITVLNKTVSDLEKIIATYLFPNKVSSKVHDLFKDNILDQSKNPERSKQAEQDLKFLNRSIIKSLSHSMAIDKKVPLNITPKKAFDKLKSDKARGA